ncbi:MAG: 23S rRNA (adenine(2503)-C(2))-methyltransferase RlmN [Fibrobacterales bacterium]
MSTFLLSFPAMIKEDIKSLSKDALKEFLLSHSVKAYRSDQVYSWIFKQSVSTFEDMVNVPENVRKILSESYTLRTLKENNRQVSSDGTIKWTLRTHDDKLIETVLIPSSKRQSICISTQVGCAMGCKFCSTAKMGFIRNLSVGEIIEQVMFVNEHLANKGLAISNVVFMGMGEPMRNADNVQAVVQILQDDKLFALAQKRITVSTSGVISKIYEFADKDTPCKLAISLNGTNNAMRESIMPINKGYPLEKLLEAVDYYIEKTNNYITFEYILIKGLTCTEQAAKELLGITKGRNVKVNCIPINAGSDNGLQPPSEEDVQKFINTVNRGGTYIIKRTPRGQDIFAACGQLVTQQQKVA